jgi:type I restriction enzyme S subunit
MSRTRVKFGDVVINVNETLRNESEHSFSRVVGLEHIDSGDPELRRWDELSSLPEGTSFTKIFRRGHVLFGKRRAYQRKVAVASFDGICSSDILVFTPSDKRLDLGFLLYIVQSEGFFAHALQTSSGSLSPRTRWQDLASFEFELPSLDEQERILELLSAVDAHAEALRNQVMVGQDTRRVIMSDLLSAGGEGWIETTLGDIAEYINGYPFKPGDLGDDGTAVIRIKQLLDPLEKVDRTTAAVPERCILSNGDIVFSWSGTLAVRVWNRGHAYLNQHLFRVVEKTGVSHEWLPLVIDHAIKDLLEKSHGTTMKHITKQTLLPHQVFLPPLDEQQRIVDEISKIDVLIQETNSALTATQQLRSALLNKEIS